MMTRSIPSAPPPPATDVGDEAAAVLDRLAGSPGGGQAWVEGGECKGWLRVMGGGSGGTQWYGSAQAGKPVLIPRGVACALSDQIGAKPVSYVETSVSNRGRTWAVRVQRPWTAPKSATPIRSAIARWIFGTTVT